MARIFYTLIMIAAALTASAKYTTIADTLRASRIFPGTSHAFTITVPEGYSPERPAALYLSLDGELCNAPAVIDSLTTAGIMPITIGIYLQPGIITANDGTVLRYNRSNEFDNTSDRFARFLDSELLPTIEALSTPDGRPIRLSANPSDRMIAGLSSGGICAFVTAWHRPDLFARVFSGCGTFVAMRGGNDLEAIVRKHQPKPLRIFLQDGFDDVWNPLFGHWYEHNRLLASALEFAGYDCRFDWAEGGHSVRRATEIFAEMMTWMWRDYPTPITAGSSANSSLHPLIIPGEQWQATQGSFSPHPTLKATYPDGSIMAGVLDNPNHLYQWILDNQGNKYYGQTFYWLHSYDNALLSVASLAFDGEGNLWALTSAGIQICDQNGRVRAILSLPQGLNLMMPAEMVLADNLLTITTETHRYTLKINVISPTKGTRPTSQGQG